MVALITPYQKELLTGKEFAPGCYFNPIEDANGNWVISIEEVEQCTNPDFPWVKDLTTIVYEPKHNTDDI
jgi:hypothetical protein